MPLVKAKGMLATFVVAPRLAISVFVALVIVVAVSACGSNPDTAPLAAAAIVINAPDGSIPVGGTMQFSATVTDANGNTITTTPTWTLVNGGGAITSAGLFTAGDSIGTFTNTIVATIGAVTSASSVNVSAGGLATITITPAVDTLAIEAMQEFEAVGHDAFGHVVDIPAGLVWSVSSPTAGTIDTSGYFSAGTVAGPYTVTATSGSTAGHASVVLHAGPLASITVSPTPDTLDQGATRQFTAVGKDAHDNVVAVTVAWVAGAGGTLSSSGLFTAGTVAATFPNAAMATSGAITGNAAVTVRAGALASIVVTPPNGFITAGAPLQYFATGADGSGNVVPVTGVVWSVAAASSAAGTISSTGLFTASMAYGSYANAIVATSGSITGSASVTLFNPLPCPPFCGGPFPF